MYPWRVQSWVTVHGQPAPVGAMVANGQVYGRGIFWSAGGYTFSVSTSSTRSSQRALPATELTKIAVGLRP
jgi:hypothetical protein